MWFRVNVNSVVAWMSVNCLLETGAISKVWVVATKLQQESIPQPLNSKDIWKTPYNWRFCGHGST